jgi:hypothetical protein
MNLRRQRFPARFSAGLAWLAVLVTSWEAPLPVWHCHGTLASAEPTRWLAEHLHDHHAEIGHWHQAFLNWHLHFDFPHRADDTGQSAPDHLLVPVAGDAMGVTPSVYDGFRGWRPNLFLTATAAAVRTSPADRDCPARSRHFYDDYAAKLPLPLRFGVYRC